MDRYANSPCSPELAEESSAESCSAGGLSAPSSSTPTQRAYLWRDKTTGAWNRFPSGMTCEPLTDDRGADVLTSFLAAFPARTSALPEEGQESTEENQGSGPKCRESLAKYDHDSRSWKTRQCLLLGGLAEFSETWPRWGMTRRGEFFRLACLAPHTHGKGCSLWATPRASRRGMTVDDNPRRKASGGCRSLESDLAMLHPGGGPPNPQWVEWLVGFPIGLTGLEPLGIAKFRAWQHSHGEFLRSVLDSPEN